MRGTLRDMARKSIELKQKMDKTKWIEVDPA